MGKPERMIVVCEKCGARLKLKPIQLKILKEVKCGKCGNRIPTSNAVSADAAPPAVDDTPLPAPEEMTLSAPADEQLPEPAAATPVPAVPLKSETITPRPSLDAAIAASPSLEAPVAPAVPFRAPTPPPVKERTQTLKTRTANFGPSPLRPGDESPAALKAQNAELQAEINVFRQQIIGLEAQIARQQTQIERFQEPEMLQRIADAENTITELQEVLRQKDASAQDLAARIERLGAERDEAHAVRDSILNNIKDLLATYHSTEYDAARKRLQDLDERIDRFVTLIRQRDVPAAPEPPSPIREAREHRGEE